MKSVGSINSVLLSQESPSRARPLAGILGRQRKLAAQCATFFLTLLVMGKLWATRAMPLSNDGNKEIRTSETSGTLRYYSEQRHSVRGGSTACEWALRSRQTGASANPDGIIIVVTKHSKKHSSYAL
jgi:hypothetical protein